MRWYIVFGSTKRPKGFTGGTYLDWQSKGPIGVYQAETAEQAYIQAAKDSNDVGTFFVIEGTPFGVEMVDQQAQVLGGGDSPQERLAASMERFERTTRQIEQLTRGQLPAAIDSTSEDS